MSEKKDRVIGAWYIYTSAQPAYLFDQPVLLSGICKADAPEDSEQTNIRNDTFLAQEGGIQPGDIAFIRQWLPSKHRPSWVEGDCLADVLRWMPEEQWPCDAIEAVMYYAIDAEGNVLAQAEATDPRHAEAIMTNRIMADPDKYARWSANNFVAVSTPPCNCGV